MLNDIKHFYQSKYWLWVSAVIASISIPTVHAGIMINPMVVEFNADELPRKEITVMNQGESIAYVDIEVFQVLHPGTDEEEQIIVTNTDEIDFIVSPSKLAIPPGGQRRARLISLVTSDQERVYRVNFTPILPPLEDEEGIGVIIVVAYQALIMIQPEKPVANLMAERHGHQLIFRNKGNVYALVSGVTQCNPDNTDCNEELKVPRLFPGNTFVVDLPSADLPVSYRVKNFKGSQRKVIH